MTDFTSALQKMINHHKINCTSMGTFLADVAKVIQKHTVLTDELSGVLQNAFVEDKDFYHVCPSCGTKTIVSLGSCHICGHQLLSVTDSSDEVVEKETKAKAKPVVTKEEDDSVFEDESLEETEKEDKKTKSTTKTKEKASTKTKEKEAKPKDKPKVKETPKPVVEEEDDDFSFDDDEEVEEKTAKKTKATSTTKPQAEDDDFDMEEEEEKPSKSVDALLDDDNLDDDFSFDDSEFDDIELD